MWPARYRKCVDKNFHIGSSSCFKLALVTFVRVSVADQWFLSHFLTYSLGFHKFTGGPCNHLVADSLDQ